MQTQNHMVEFKVALWSTGYLGMACYYPGETILGTETRMFLTTSSP